MSFFVKEREIGQRKPTAQIRQLDIRKRNSNEFTNKKRDGDNY